MRRLYHRMADLVAYFRGGSMEYIENYEPNVLKNEVIVRAKEMMKLFENCTVFVFGYGSLLYPEGWEGRGLYRFVKDEDLIECELKGFERGPWGLYADKNFYGIIRTPGKTTNGVLLQIKTLREWVNLMSTEMIAGLYNYANYRVVDITNDVVVQERLPENAVIHAVCNRPVNRKKFFETIPHTGYYDRVWQGVKKHRSSKFVKKFLEGGGVTGDIAIETRLRNHIMGRLGDNAGSDKRRKVSGVRKRKASRKS